MSIIISVEHADEVAILTDGAAVSRDGRLAWVGRKVTISEKVPLAVAARGDHAFSEGAAAVVAELVEEHGFDGGMQVLGEVLDGFASDKALEVLIAGVSEEHGPRHMTFVNAPNAGVEPFELTHANRCFTLATDIPEPFDWSQMGVRAPFPGERPAPYFLAFGAAWIAFFRKHRGENSRGQRRFAIGGQVDLTVVNREGVTVQTIHRWPEDKVGEKIDPFRASKTVSPIAAGMSRQQRRQAERDARMRLAKSRFERGWRFSVAPSLTPGSNTTA